MSTVSFNATSAQTLINQGFHANPSGFRLNRRGRLARTFVVLSLAVVLASVFGLLATRMADGGDVRSLVDEIASVNSLATAELQAGQKVRIPLR